MEPSSSTSTEEELDLIFLDAPDEFYYDCFPIRNSSLSATSLRRRESSSSRKFVCSDMAKEPSLFSNGFEVVEKSSFVERSDDLERDLETSDVIESSKVLVDLNSSGKEKNLDVIDSVKDQEKDLDSGPEKTEESTVTTMSNDLEDDHAVLTSEPQATDWSLVGFLVGLVIKAIEFQVSLMISLITFPPWLLHNCSLVVFDPFRTIRLARRFLIGRVAGISDMVLGTMSPFKLDWFKDTKQMLSVACKFGWGFFWAVYVGIVLFGLLVTALMFSGVVINRIADEPFVVKESLNFDYTKNSPEAFVPITSCAGVFCDGSSEMGKIRGRRVIPRDHKLEITLAMTLPESVYNKNLGMFQVRVDFLSADGQRLASIRRPCMLRFRSEPIRFVQTFFKVVPLVTGYVSEIQTLSLKLNGFVEKDVPTACLKIMIEQRAEYRPGAGIPELYDASLSVESDLPFFKRIIWKWRKTLFVWISMSLFITELLFALVCCRPLIIPRTRRRDRPPPSNPTASR